MDQSFHLFVVFLDEVARRILGVQDERLDQMLIDHGILETISASFSLSNEDEKTMDQSVNANNAFVQEIACLATIVYTPFGIRAVVAKHNLIPNVIKTSLKYYDKLCIKRLFGLADFVYNISASPNTNHVQCLVDSDAIRLLVRLCGILDHRSFDALQNMMKVSMSSCLEQLRICDGMSQFQRANSQRYNRLALEFHLE